MSTEAITNPDVTTRSRRKDEGRRGGWIKARASDQGGNCVQMRLRQGLIEVRDSKVRRGPVLRFTTEEFAAWLDGARRGEFDHFANG
jgi:hypothetical protein